MVSHPLLMLVPSSGGPLLGYKGWCLSSQISNFRESSLSVSSDWPVVQSHMGDRDVAEGIKVPQTEYKIRWACLKECPFLFVTDFCFLQSSYVMSQVQQDIRNNPKISEGIKSHKWYTNQEGISRKMPFLVSYWFLFLS